MPTFYPADPDREVLRAQENDLLDAGFGSSSDKVQAVRGMVQVWDSNQRAEMKLSQKQADGFRAAYWAVFSPQPAGTSQTPPAASAGAVVLYLTPAEADALRAILRRLP